MGVPSALNSNNLRVRQVAPVALAGLTPASTRPVEVRCRLVRRILAAVVMPPKTQ